MSYVVCVFGGFMAGLLAGCLARIGRGPEGPSRDDMGWYDL